MRGNDKRGRDPKYTNADLKTMQAWPLERKIQVTQTRILEWYNHYHGKVFVSFSGGKDSTVLLDLARRMYPDIPAVFVDTGLEFPELREFVKSVDNVTWLKPKMNFRQVLLKYGYPLISKETAMLVHYGRQALERGDTEQYNRYISGARGNGKSWHGLSDIAQKLMGTSIPVSNQCCYVMKKAPIHAYEKSEGRHAIVATMAAESLRRRTQWLQDGCNVYDAHNPTSKPMSFWTEQDVLQYIKRFDIPYCKAIYGDIVEEIRYTPKLHKPRPTGKLTTTGRHRTGCVFCAFGAHLEKEPNRFQLLKQTHPKLWDYCMRPTQQGGLGMKEVLEYIGVKTGCEEECKNEV